jgi:hypothetical protein
MQIVSVGPRLEIGDLYIFEMGTASNNALLIQMDSTPANSYLKIRRLGLESIASPTTQTTKKRLDVLQHLRALGVERGNLIQDFLRAAVLYSSPPLGFFTERSKVSLSMVSASTLQLLGESANLFCSFTNSARSSSLKQ